MTMKDSDLMIIPMPQCTRVMHAKCLTSIGRTKPECLSCDEIKVKPEPRDGGGGPPNPDDD
eukprot:467559-Amphidinium_carterae.1